MIAAATGPRAPADARLFVVGHGDAGRVSALRFQRGDVVVLNDAATLPASLVATDATGHALELRLVAADGAGWRAVLFGEGDWRSRTEDRPLPRRYVIGERLHIGADLRATVVEVDRESPRLVRIAFDREGPELFRALYHYARPIQYAHQLAALPLYAVQTRYAGVPWAVEMPSAGWPLSVQQLMSWRRDGAEVVSLTHAAGLSSTGDAALDARLPFAERYHLPDATAAVVRATKGRVIAIGTSVVRALEGSGLRPGTGVTDLRIGPAYRLRVVDALLTGMHELGTSHRALLQAFQPEAALRRAEAEAARLGYRSHEFGDLCFVASDPANCT